MRSERRHRAILLVVVWRSFQVSNSLHSVYLNEAIWSASAFRKAGRSSHRAKYIASVGSEVTNSVCRRVRSTVAVIRSPTVKRSSSQSRPRRRSARSESRFLTIASQ